MDKAELGATLSGNQNVNPPLYDALAKTIGLPLSLPEAQLVVQHFRYGENQVDLVVGQVAALLNQFRKKAAEVITDESGQHLLFDSGDPIPKDKISRKRGKKSLYRPDQMEFWADEMPDDPTMN